MRPCKSLIAAFMALAGVVQVQAAYFVYAHNALIRTRLDAIVTPGRVSGHVHVFSGSAHVEADATFASITSAECTTSPFQDDKSGYWAPQLYYKHRDRTYTALSGDGLVTYWKYLGLKAGEKYAVVPDDFRMLAGDVKRDHLDTSLAGHNAVSFQCFGPGYDYMFPYIPADFECETIRPQVYFPSCWNGVDAYKEDNSHVSYPTGNDFEHGPCPAGFKRIPGLFMEAYYKPSAMLGAEYEWYPGCLVLANGDNFGLSYHADWLNGLPRGLIVDAFETCGDTLDGQGQACPLLAASYDEAKGRSCNPRGHVVNEPVGLQQRLRFLPGNNMEYNSSREANKPKVARSGYTDMAQIVQLNDETGGGCKAQRCTDYSGDGVPADLGPVGGGTTTNGGNPPFTSDSTTSASPTPTTPAIGATGGPVMVTRTVTRTRYRPARSDSSVSKRKRARLEHADDEDDGDDQ